MSSILQRIARQDVAAVDEAIAAYGGMVYRLARRYLDRAPGEVEDAVQDVFVELWLKADAFDPDKGSEAAFVATIAHRKMIDRQRRLAARRRAERAAQAAAPPKQSTCETAMADSSARALEAFESLPEPERMTLYLAVHQGLTLREVSESLEVSVNTVKSRKRRALARIWAILKQDASTHESARAKEVRL